MIDSMPYRLKVLFYIWTGWSAVTMLSIPFVLPRAGLA